MMGSQLTTEEPEGRKAQGEGFSSGRHANTPQFNVIVNHWNEDNANPGGWLGSERGASQCLLEGACPMPGFWRRFGGIWSN